MTTMVKLALCSLLVVGLSYFAYRELQIDTRGLTINIHIPAKRSDVFRKMFDDPEFFGKINPFSTEVINVLRSQDENGQRIVQYDYHKKLVIFGFYEMHGSVHATVKEVEKNTSTQMTAKTLGGMLHINQRFHVSDAGDGGSLLEDHVEITAPRILARFIRSVAHGAHIEITEKIKRYFLQASQQA